MNDSIEQALKIDAFRQAISRDQQPLLGIAHGLDARAPLFRRQFAGDRLDSELREMPCASPSATCSAVAMKRQNTTGLAPSAISGLSSFDSASSFGSAALVKALGLRDEGGKWTVLLQAGGQARHQRRQLRRHRHRTLGLQADPDRRQGDCAARSRRQRATSQRNASGRACPRMPAGGDVDPGQPPRRHQGSNQARHHETLGDPQ